MNNLKVHSITSRSSDELFGFMEGEVDEILNHYSLSDRKEEERDWYDGYTFGGADVYCPWDVINYCCRTGAAGGGRGCP